MIKQTLMAASAVALMSGAAVAQDNPVNLNFSLWIAPVHPLYKGMEEWAASLNEASGGTISVTMYPSEQLGKAVDHYDMARDGIADLTFINPGYNAGRFPVISYGELPFVFNSAEGGSRALDAYYRPHAAAEMADVKFCMAFIHSPGTIHMTKPVVQPSDLQGLAVRPANGTSGQFLTGMGATTVQASAAELRDLLARGTADGTASPYSSVITWGAGDHALHHLDMPMFSANFALIVSPAAWARLSPAQQEALDAHCTTDWAGQVVTHWGAEDLEQRAVLEADARHVFHVPNAEQAAQWHAAAEPVVARWREAVTAAGHDAAALEAEFQAAIATYDAGN